MVSSKFFENDLELIIISQYDIYPLLEEMKTS